MRSIASVQNSVINSVRIWLVKSPVPFLRKGGGAGFYPPFLKEGRGDFGSENNIGTYYK